MGRGGQVVGHVLPVGAEDAAQARRQQVGAVEGLDAERDGADDGAQEDEEEGPVHAHGRARQHRVADVVPRPGARHADDDQPADEGAQHARYERLLPRLVWCILWSDILMAYAGGGVVWGLPGRRRSVKTPHSNQRFRRPWKASITASYTCGSQH